MKYIKVFENHAQYDAAESSLILPNVSHCIQENEVHYNPYFEPKVVANFDITSAGEAKKILNRITAVTEIEIDGVVQPTVESSYTFSTTGAHVVKYTLADPQNISANAFYSVEMTSLVIPKSVTTIGYFSFGYCNQLTALTIPNSVTTVDAYVFNTCKALVHVDLPDSITSIGDNTFGYCSGLTSVHFPKYITSIPYSTFMGCKSLVDVNLENGVTKIEYAAFQNCTALSSITIPSSVTTFESQVFDGCANLSTIVSLPTTAPVVKADTFRNVKTGGTLTVPNGSTGYDVWMGTGNYYLGKYNWTKVEQ